VSRVVRFGAFAVAYAVFHNKAKAQKLLKELRELSERRFVSAYDFAILYAGLGEKDQAFEWLERAYEERSLLPGHEPEGGAKARQSSIGSSVSGPRAPRGLASVKPPWAKPSGFRPPTLASPRLQKSKTLNVENPLAIPAHSGKGYSGLGFRGWHDGELPIQISHDASPGSWRVFLVLVNARRRGADKLPRRHMAQCLDLLSRRT